jgi:plasmid stabilization system protein ParE
MTQVRVSAAAQSDVEITLVDLALKAGGETALRYLSLFEKLYRLFERFPTCGAPRPHLGRHIRIGVADPYVVFYRYDEQRDTVFIQRVLHGKQDVTRAMFRKLGDRQER